MKWHKPSRIAFCLIAIIALGSPELMAQRRPAPGAHSQAESGVVLSYCPPTMTIKVNEGITAGILQDKLVRLTLTPETKIQGDPSLSAATVVYTLGTLQALRVSFFRSPESLGMGVTIRDDSGCPGQQTPAPVAVRPTGDSGGFSPTDFGATASAQQAAARAQQAAAKAQQDIYDVKWQCKQLDGVLTVGRGDVLKNFCAAEFYENGAKGVPKDPSAAKRYRRLSADAGFAAGQVAVGDEYWESDSVQARAWYEKAAAQKFGTAQYRIGRLYFLGNGVTKNRSEALKWYRLAAANGSRDAKYYLAQIDAGFDPERPQPAADLYAEGWRLFNAGDKAAAARPMLAAARAGNSLAQINIGWQYEHGAGVPQNYSEAAVWYGKAADQGQASAMSNLGEMYEDRKGVPEDWVQSAKWYQKSAAFGDAMGQSRLAYAYQFGVGVPQSRKLAISWHYEAAVQGNGVSASEYGRLSKSGSNFIGFHDANERALFRALPTVLISAEPAGTAFHNSAERMAYMSRAAQQHEADEQESARYVEAAAYQRQKDEYDRCKGAGGSNCHDPGPRIH